MFRVYILCSYWRPRRKFRCYVDMSNEVNNEGNQRVIDSLVSIV